jgi:hypothetical protein
MVWWQTLLVALASSIVGGVLTSAGTYAMNVQQQRSQKRVQAVESIAAILTALRELDPEVYGERLRLDERGRELIADKRTRWLAAAGRLEVLAATHPDSDIASLSESVISKGGLVLIRLDERIDAASELSDAWLKAIPEQHRAAIEDARRLARLMVRS